MKLKAKVTRATGAAKHSIGTILDGRPVAILEAPVPAAVEILAEGSGCLLLRLDESGECVADTWHPTIDEAKRMAQVEYGIEERHWTTED